MATPTAKQSRLRIKPEIYDKLEALAKADRRKPTDQAEVLIEGAFDRWAKKAALAVAQAAEVLP